MKTKDLIMLTGAGLLLAYFLKQRSSAPAYTGPDQAAVPQPATLQPGGTTALQNVQNNFAALYNAYNN